jgi:hypothetical protein
MGTPSTAAGLPPSRARVNAVGHAVPTTPRALEAIWRKEQRHWEITFRDSKRLVIVDRIIESDSEHPSTRRYAPAYGALHK